MKLFKTAEQYLDYYYSKYGFHYRVQCWNNNGPQPWCNYKSDDWNQYIKEYEFVNNRERFVDEIIFDIDIDGDIPDSEKKQRAQKVSLEICQRLVRLGYEYTVWNSGGNGCHIHMFFPELFKYNKSQRDYLKKAFMRYIGPDFLDASDGNAHICSGTAVLIQLEQALHRKGGRKELTGWYETPTENKLPSKILDDLRLKLVDNDPKKAINLFTDIPNAIRFLEQEDFSNLKDGRHRALFVLACYYSKFLNDEQLFDKLYKWNHYQLRGYLQPRSIRSTIKSIRKRDSKNMPLFPFKFLRDLMEELGTQVDYSDITFK